jgi:hypothetical protein
MAQMRPGFFVGGEARYLRNMRASACRRPRIVRRSDRLFQAVGELAADVSLELSGVGAFSPIYASLDRIDFERHQARLVFGVNF